MSATPKQAVVAKLSLLPVIALISKKSSKKNLTHDLLIVLIAALVIGGFLVYEYRHTISGFFKKYLPLRKYNNHR
jgi:hypothetical protein